MRLEAQTMLLKHRVIFKAACHTIKATTLPILNTQYNHIVKRAQPQTNLSMTCQHASSILFDIGCIQAQTNKILQTSCPFCSQERK